MKDWKATDEVDALVQGHATGQVTDAEAAARAAEIARMLIAEADTRGGKDTTQS